MPVGCSPAGGRASPVATPGESTAARGGGAAYRGDASWDAYREHGYVADLPVALPVHIDSPMSLYRDFDTPAQLDTEYDVDGVTPDTGSCVERLLAASARARRTLPHELDVPYGPTRAEVLDVFPAEPRDGERPPLLVYFHGGYWRQLSGHDFDFVALGLVPHGITTLVPTYALCPHATMDEIVRQARAAVAWAYRNAEALGADPDRVLVGGHSAGAHLAAMCALTDWEGEYGLPADLVKGCIAMSGLYDLRPLPFTSIGSSLLLPPPATAPPTLVAFGDGETFEFQRQSNDLADHWLEHGVPVDVHVQHGRHHFEAALELTDPSSAIVEAIAVHAGVPALVAV